MENQKASIRDVKILRELANQVNEIAYLPIQRERKKLWSAMNSLKPERPLVAVYPERAWAELVTNSVLQCENELMREWEMILRRTIFHHEFVNDDRPLHNKILIPWEINWGDIGVKITEIHSNSKGSEAISWDPPIKSFDDVEKLHYREIHLNREETFRKYQLAKEIFGGVLDVQIFGGLPFWSIGLSQLIMLRGLEQSMIDMYE